MLKLFKDRNFLIFWVGNFISAVGDHVSIIAFPWLVLVLTDSPAMMGLVFAAQGLPRAIFMLTGGVLVDKTSPRLVMIVCNLVRLIIVLLLAWMLLTNSVSVTEVFLFAIAFGLADAFYFPAANAVVPSLVSSDKLKEGNALVQMAIQLSIIIGPMIGGFLIAGSLDFSTLHGAETGSSSGDINFEGLSNAFIFDAATFFISWLTLLFTKVKDLKEESQHGDSLLGSIKKGISFVWNTPALRLVFFGIMCLDFFFMAPVFVGLPVLAKARFEEGALIYAMELMAYGVGALAGGLLAGVTRGPKTKNLVKVAFAVWAFSGLTICSVIFFYSVVPPMILFVLAGIGDSWIWIFLVTWIQQITPEKMMGRVMSILMFLSVGMLPIANMLVGMLLEWHIEAVFIIAGLAIFIISCVCILHPDSGKADIRPVGAVE